MLAVRGLEPEHARVGREVGLVYAFNTTGAIAGSLLSGLVLLPVLGAPRSLAALAAVNALGGLLVLRSMRDPSAAAEETRRARLRGRIAIGVVAACGATLALPAARFVRAFLDATRNPDTIGELL